MTGASAGPEARGFGHSAGWMLARVLVMNVAAVVRVTVLARVLGPYELGALATASTILVLADTLTFAGIDHYAIQRPDLVSRDFRVLWSARLFAAIGAALVIAGGVVVTAVVPSMLPATAPLAVLIAVPLLRACGSPTVLQAERQQQFARIARFEGVAALIEVGIVLTVAWVSPTAVSAAMAVACAAAVQSVLSLLFFRPCGTPLIERARLRDLFGASRSLWVTALGSYVTLQVDNLVVSALLGQRAVGVYTTAYQFSQWPVMLLAQGTNRVARARLARVQSNLVALHSEFGAYLTLSVVGLSAMIGTLWLAAPLIGVLLGASRWHDVGLLFRWLLLVSAGRGIAIVLDVALLSTGRFRGLARAKSVEVVLFVPGVVAGAYLAGLPGVAVGAGLAYLVAALLRFVLLRVDLGIRLAGALGTTLGLFGAAAGLTAVCSLATHSLGTNARALVSSTMFVAVALPAVVAVARRSLARMSRATPGPSAGVRPSAS